MNLMCEYETTALKLRSSVKCLFSYQFHGVTLCSVSLSRKLIAEGTQLHCSAEKMKRPREREGAALRVVSTTSSAPLTNNIATFLDPVRQPEFMSEFYTKKALAVKCHPKSRDGRVAVLKEVMDQFNPLEMLNNSSSDEISVWLPQIQDRSKPFNSIKVDAAQAKMCYDAGHSLYFRASEALEAMMLPAFADSLGHGFAASFRDRLRRSEIETFVSHIGHTTGWHWDFQDNFTVQLRGAKRWYLHPGPSPQPHRAMAIHFTADEKTTLVHLQRHMAQLANPSFSGSLPDDIETECESVLLQPGDVLYHPAGMWHKVETVAAGESPTNSLSINMSLFPMTWADLLGETSQQLMLRHDSMRERIRYTSLDDLRERLSQRIALLQGDISEHMTAAAIVPPLFGVDGGAMVAMVTHDSCDVDGLELQATTAASAASSASYKRNVLGTLSMTPPECEIPLRKQRSASNMVPSAFSDNDGEDDHDEEEEEEEEEEGGEAVVECPEGFVRFDYHANYIAEEAFPGVAPALHSIVMVEEAADGEADLVQALMKLALFTGGTTSGSASVGSKKGKKSSSGAVPSSLLAPFPAGFVQHLLNIGFLLPM